MKVTIAAQHLEADEELKRYVTRKLSKLDRYLPRHARHTAHAEVHLIQLRGKGKNPHQCDVLLRLPHGELVAKEATVNMFAAVDIVEAKLRNQLLKYKEKTIEHDAWRSRVWRRLGLKGSKR